MYSTTHKIVLSWSDGDVLLREPLKYFNFKNLTKKLVLKLSKRQNELKDDYEYMAKYVYSNDRDHSR